MMPPPKAGCFEFRFVVAGLDFDDEASLDLLHRDLGGDVSVSSTTTDLVEVVVTTPGDDALVAVNSAIARVGSLLEHVDVLRLDQELVGISDIAQLTGRTREAIRLYADGKRGAGHFPAPMGVVGDSVRVWRWADVDAWLREHAGYDFPTTPVPSWVIDRVNVALSASATRHGGARGGTSDPSEGRGSSLERFGQEAVG